MNTIEDFTNKYKITELDLYVLSKLEADKSSAKFINKDVIKAKQASLLTKYKFNIFERKKFLNLLKNNPIHNNIVFQEKYKDTENDAVLEGIGKKAKKKLVIIAIVVIVMASSFWNKANAPEPCGCVGLLLAKPNKSTFSYEITDDIYPKWEKCYDAYAGPAGATIECDKKNK